jgi:4-hydroxysphinganine ceramide fatty acyl 2-hydroxylase
MTNFDRFAFYRRPRERFRQLRAVQGRRFGERFTDSNAFLRKFAAHKSNYLGGFITDPATAVIITIWDVAFFRSNIFLAVPCFALGVGSFTLIEYAFHRFVYHKGNTIAHTGHLMHHESPRLLLGMPWFITSGFLWALWYIFAVRLHLHFVASFVGGFGMGYFIYCSVHHIQHHYAFANTWFRELTRHHNIHHCLLDVNFGVTNRFWDRVFRTEYRKDDYKLKAATRGKSPQPPAVAGG